MRYPTRTVAWVAAAGLLMTVPPVGMWLESTMTRHMLVQLPLLTLGGWWVGGQVSALCGIRLAALRRYRWALLVVAAATMSVWMIPRLLDLAVASAAVDAVKVLTVVLAGGLPLRLAWLHLGPVARGIVHLEALASVWRLAWLYTDSPSRLCTQYGLADQQRLGGLLLHVGALYAAWLLWLALRGTPGHQAVRQE